MKILISAKPHLKKHLPTYNIYKGNMAINPKSFRDPKLSGHRAGWEKREYYNIK